MQIYEYSGIPIFQTPGWGNKSCLLRNLGVPEIQGVVFDLEKEMTPGSNPSQIFNYNNDLSFYVFLFVQQERIDIEEKYANLQEEATGKTKKLKKVWSMLMSAKSEVFVQHAQ